VILTVENANEILPSNQDEDNGTSFVLEKYLEEFIVSNWGSIELGSRYDRNEEEIDGKRKKFRTDTGEIDIFAISKDESEYLVIEVKKGRASDEVVGQIQRYMGYVKAEIANTDQRVKGLIIAHEDDLRIRRALQINPDIDFLKYEVKWELTEV
jgi:restriction system protein